MGLDDWVNLLWALKSFYWASGRKYALCIHSDGSLENDHKNTLHEHFPDARLIDRSAADNRVLSELEGYLKCQDFRRKNHFAPKLFDFRVYSQSDHILSLDSDVLFFEEPTELLRRVEDPTYHKNSVNRDVDSAYTVDPGDVRAQFGFELVPQFNAGLGLIHRDSIRLDWIEAFLELPDIRSHSWRIEQTLYALCSSRYGVELLPESYDVHLGEGIQGPVRHYVGGVRHLMYDEGIRRLVGSNMLQG